jgi:ABC-type antimicrobial peptide transport system permease subunit
VIRAADDDPLVQPERASRATDLLHDTIRAERFRSWLFGSFSVSALLIVCVGVLGLMALGARRRTREIGVRLALGAHPSSIVRLMLREQLLAIVLGLAIGGAASFWIVEGLRAYLYETTPYDAGVWIAAVAVIVIAALVGVLLPAVRASRLDPAAVLRAE